MNRSAFATLCAILPMVACQTVSEQYQLTPDDSVAIDGDQRSNPGREPEGGGGTGGEGGAGGAPPVSPFVCDTKPPGHVYKRETADVKIPAFCDEKFEVACDDPASMLLTGGCPMEWDAGQGSVTASTIVSGYPAELDAGDQPATWKCRVEARGIDVTARAMAWCRCGG